MAAGSRAARAAAQRSSADALANEGSASHETPAAALSDSLRIRGMEGHQLSQLLSDIRKRKHPGRSSRLDEFSRHAPHNSRFLRLSDRPPTQRPKPRHGSSAIVAHAGHQNADQEAGRNMRDGALHQPVGARMPRAPGIGGHWSRDEIARDRSK